MTNHSRRAPALVISLIVAGGLAPLLLYWWVVGRAPSVSPSEALAALGAPQTQAVLVDIRDPDAFAASHLDGAVSWPLREIGLGRGLPAGLSGKTLFLICDGGLSSARAVPKVRKLTSAPLYSVRGGIQGWIFHGGVGSSGRFCASRSSSGNVTGFPFKTTTPLEQWLAVLHAFVLKPLYTIAALVLVVLLWRNSATDMSALRWGLLAFFIGEEACAANFLFLGDASLLLEYLHDYGMVLCFGFCAYTLIAGLDSRVIRYSAPGARCAFLGVCRTCIKNAPVPCGLERMFFLVLPAALVLATMPLFLTPEPLVYTTEILHRTYALSHPVVHQVFESKICAVAALVLLGISLLVFCFKWNGRVRWAELFFAAGLGPMGFSLFRLVLFWAYREDLGRFNLWEEVTEFLFVASVAGVLWIFRKGLLARDAQGESPAMVNPGPRV